MLQVGLRGKPIHLMPNPPLFTKMFPDGVMSFIYPKNLIEWEKQLINYISNKSHRNHVAEIQYKYLNLHYSTENWKNQINTLYQKMSATNHQVKTNILSTFYSTVNEHILSNQDLRLKINHLSFSIYNLPFFQKIKHLLILVKYKPATVEISKKSILNFLFKNKA